jgi:putative transposase
MFKSKLVLNLDDAKSKIETWREEYNSYRPHSSLRYKTPEEFANLQDPL